MQDTKKPCWDRASHVKDYALKPRSDSEDSSYTRPGASAPATGGPTRLLVQAAVSSPRICPSLEDNAPYMFAGVGLCGMLQTSRGAPYEGIR